MRMADVEESGGSEHDKLQYEQHQQVDEGNTNQVAFEGFKEPSEGQHARCIPFQKRWTKQNYIGL
jgi:hypothetical protein